MSLLSGAKSFFIILYADKTYLLSFSIVQGYPVVARCGNLLVHICNSEGISDGCMVDWLPTVCVIYLIFLFIF